MHNFSNDEILKLYEMLKISTTNGNTDKNLFPVPPDNNFGWSVVITANTEEIEVENG